MESTPTNLWCIVRFMLSNLLLLLVSIHITAQPDISNIKKNKTLIQQIKTGLDSTMKAENIPAVSIGIIRDGALLLHTGLGLLERGQDKKVNEQTIYQIGSLSKMFTGIIANHLTSAGKLDLQESILTYLPATISAKAKKRLAGVTVEHLLLHRSGIRRDPPTNRRKNGNAPLLIEYTEADMIHDLNKLTLKSAPGAEVRYSNYGYAVLGYICEQAGGMEFPALVKKYVTEPYGLTNTFLYPNDEQKTCIPMPYQPNHRERKTAPWKMGKLAPAGGIFSNTTDLLKLMSRQMESYRQFLETGRRDALVLTNQNDPVGLHYGYGLYKNVKADRTFYFHGGDLDGFSSVYIFSPENNFGLIILTSSGGSWIHYGLTDWIMDRLVASAN